MREQGDLRTACKRYGKEISALYTVWMPPVEFTEEEERTLSKKVGWLVGYYLVGPAPPLAGGGSSWSAEASAEVLVAGRLRSRVGGCGKCF